MTWLGRLAIGATAGGGLAAGYLGPVSGAVFLDAGAGRRTRPLGPQSVGIAASR